MAFFFLWEILALWKLKNKKFSVNCSKGFFGKFTQKSPYLEEKNLEVAKFRQWVLVY